jgi:hypothetical protein
MNKKDFIRILNEEIKNFDFLGNDEHQKEQETIDLLKNPDLQKQFICDSLLNKNAKIKIDILDAIISGDYEEGPEEANNITIEYNLKIQYTYDQSKEPLTFDLTFDGDNVPISVDSDYDKGVWAGTMPDSIPPSGGDWISSIDWRYITVKMWSDGEEIPFTTFEKAPERIQNIFIREYCRDAVEKEITVREKRPDSVKNIPYC